MLAVIDAYVYEIWNLKKYYVYLTESASALVV
jgi:hypothetical protein